MSFAVVNLGCKVNRVESDAFAAAFRARGIESAPEESADVIVVNTCTVTGEAEKKARKAVRHALRGNHHARVVVTGCAVAIDAQTYESMDERVFAIGKADLLAQITRGAYAGREDGQRRAATTAADGAEAPISVATSASEVPSTSPSLAEALPVGEGFRTRVGVKVQDGCNNACTYCIVHVARGRATSRPADEVVAECVALAQAGVREIVLTGINLGSYRCGDKSDPQAIRLAALLERLLDATADLRTSDELPTRFRVSSIEPRDIDDALIDLLAHAEGRVCRHLHLPLQSGSSKVLREMARPYDARFFTDLAARLRREVGGIALSTDVIVGFPGETQEDFQQTLDVARACRFERMHVFPYSRRAGTPAAVRPDQVPAQVKTERAATLRALAAELREEGLRARAATTELALVEVSGKAMTESYYELPADKGAKVGALLPVTFPELPGLPPTFPLSVR